MTNAFSRPEQTPEPWPITPGADGALPGDLPLTMPRRAVNSATVVITKRDTEKKITLYEARRSGDNTAVQCKIDTDNEWILRTGVALDQGRVFVGGEALARIVAEQMPSSHADRNYVDHADRDPANDTRENLHWVTPAFNSFNMERGQSASGYKGVVKSGRYWMVQFRAQYHGTYNKKTAARVYDLLCTLAYGDQLDKTPHLLNKLDQDTHVSLADTQTDGVSIYKVDNIFVVIYDVKVHSSHAALHDAKAAAQVLVDELKAQKAQKEREWAELAKKTKVKRNKEGIAVIHCSTKATDVKPSKNVEVLLDDKDWINLHVRSAKVYLGLADRAMVGIKGKPAVLSRWLCDLGGPDVVDHVNLNIYDHRRPNLAIRNRSANAQNSRRGGRSLVGVRWDLRQSTWHVYASVTGQNRRACKRVDNVGEGIELYDLAALHQHGPHALINHEDKLDDYLEMLGRRKVQSRVQDFLDGRTRTETSAFRGVYFRPARKRNAPGWAASVSSGGGKHKEVKKYPQSKKGSEVRAAIAYDLWKLKLISPDMVVNFEHLRPCYQHWLPRLTKETEDDFIEKAYNLLGGDAFDPNKEDTPPAPSPPIAGPSRAPIEVAASSAPLASTSNNPLDVSNASSPLPVSPPGSPRPSAVALGKRKARD